MSEEVYEVVAKVISKTGTCRAGHEVGDEFIIGSKTPTDLCLYGLSSLFPFATVLIFGGAFPAWEGDPHKVSVACPDPINPLVFELRRKLPDEKIKKPRKRTARTQK